MDSTHAREYSPQSPTTNPAGFYGSALRPLPRPRPDAVRRQAGDPRPRHPRRHRPAYEAARRRYAEYGRAIDDDGCLDAFEGLSDQRLRRRPRPPRAGPVGPHRGLRLEGGPRPSRIAPTRPPASSPEAGSILATLLDDYAEYPADISMGKECVMRLVCGDMADLVTAGDVEDLDAELRSAPPLPSHRPRLHVGRARPPAPWHTNRIEAKTFMFASTKTRARMTPAMPA